MRLFLALLLVSTMNAPRGPFHVQAPTGSGEPAEPRDAAPAPLSTTRLAALSDTVPGLFVSLVNKLIRGTIRPRLIRYEAPAAVVLEDLVLNDPEGQPVARVKRGRAQLSLRSLLAGELAISEIVLEEPQLLLEAKGGELNLLRAVEPRKPSTGEKPSGQIRIENIRVKNAGFRFRDDKNVTIVADDVNLTARLDVDLGRELVIFDLGNATVKSGSLRLPELDVPFSGVKASAVRIRGDVLNLEGVSAKVAGAEVVASGAITMKAPGSLNLRGVVNAPAGAWPERLQKPPFELPPIRGGFGVTGPFEKPIVDVDATFAKFVLFDLPVQSGRAKVRITTDMVRIDEGTVVNADGGGSARVTGAIVLPSLQADIKAQVEALAVAVVMKPAKLDEPFRGAISGGVNVTGIVDGKNDIAIAADVTARNVEMFGVTIPDRTAAKVRTTVSPQKPAQVLLREVALTGPDLRGSVKGPILLDAKRLDLQVELEAKDPTRFVKTLPAELAVESTRFVGSVQGPFENVRVQGQATAPSAVAFGVPVAAASARLDVTTQQVKVDQIVATVAGAALVQEEPLTLGLKGKQPLRAKLRLEGLDLDALRMPAPAGTSPEKAEKLPVSGRASVGVTLSGTVSEPVIDAAVAAGGLVASGESIGDVQATLQITKRSLWARRLLVDGPIVRASSSDFVFTFEGSKLQGTVLVQALNLANVKAAQSAQLEGTATGLVTVSGALPSPLVRADLTALGLVAGPVVIGDGKVDARLRPDDLDAKQHIIEIVADTQGEGGQVMARAAYALEREVVNARVTLRDVDLEPFTQRLGDQVAPLEGFVEGEVNLHGPLSQLTGRLRLRSPDITVRLPAEKSTGKNGKVSFVGRTQGAPVVPPSRTLGPLLIEARFDEGALQARVCGFTTEGEPDADAPCDAATRVWALISGPLDPMEQTFALSIDGYVEDKALQDIVVAIKQQDVEVGGAVRAAVQISRAKDAEVEIEATAQLLEATVLAPGAPLVSLMSPVEVSYANETAVLSDIAHFATASGDVDVGVGGLVGTEALDVDVQGTVALAILKLFTTEIANASGTANVELKASGAFAEGIAIEGMVRPSEGAVITPRALGESITFLGGTVRFTPAPDGLERIDVQGLRAQFGDGEVGLRGDVLVRTTAPEGDEAWVERWNLSATGTQVGVKFPDGRAEAGFDLVLKGAVASPVLMGRLEVTDGTVRKKLVLRDFVLSQEPGKPTVPLDELLAPVGLGNLTLDVRVSLQNFMARADISSYTAEAIVRGDLHVRRSLTLPDVQGAIEVEEGFVNFPYARFEILETQVEFPTVADGSIKPTVRVLARAEIPPGAVGNTAEVPIDLTVVGPIDQMVLDLVASDTTQTWGRGDLLALVLFGRPLNTGEGGGANAAIALRALGSELFGSVFSDTEQLLARQLGGQIDLDATGSWRWQLGRRLQIEGAGFFSTASSDTTAGTTASVGADNLRLRLLLLDHLPVGTNLSFEGRAGGGVGEVRLSYRIFEQ